MKRVLICCVVAGALVLFAGASPAMAQMVMKESTCTMSHGSNTITYDCGFNVREYTVGTPVTFTLNYACTGNCPGITSFGLRGSGFSPGGVSGHLVGGKRITGGIQLTFVFDALKETGKGSVGNAHFKANLNADDGTGTISMVPCNVDVHLQE
jgi:hypothetical protein